ncbi:MAG: endonuclease/exonuclease/phosphatase family metal-dependent hydrolase [Myxococcota bacterium]|jgi:endonuclease/exonuclease/phosphatase family metal-dependent hydrolase
MEFSVMTYNIRLGLDSDLETVAGILGEADVVAVQEVGNDWIEGEQGNQAQQLSRLSGLNHFRFASALTIRANTDPPETRPAPTADERPGYGIALLSRFPLGPWTRHRLPKRKDEQRCILSGTVVTPKGPVSVLVTHLSTNPIDRAVQVPALLRHAQTQASPLMVLGDLNGEAHDEDIRQLSSFLTNAAGDDPIPTYPTNGPEHAYDHIYISKEIEVIAPAMPLPLTGSDHLPVMAKLSL